MAPVKRLIFAPLFLLSFTYCCYQINLILQATNLVFSLKISDFIILTEFCAMILLASLFFVLFVILASFWVYVLPIAIVAALLPLIFTPFNTGVILAVGFLISFIIIYLAVENKMKAYLSFQPSSLLSPSVKNLGKLLIIVVSISYFLVVNLEVSQKGFQLPDSLLDTALNFASGESNLNIKGIKIAQVNLTPEQIEALKKNPEVLKQYGIDPKALDSLSQPAKPTPSNTSLNKLPVQTQPPNLAKTLLKSQFQKIIEPYLGVIPAILALFLFVSLYSLLSLLAIFISPLLGLIFHILEKTRFIKFTTEMRVVKKLVV